MLELPGENQGVVVVGAGAAGLTAAIAAAEAGAKITVLEKRAEVKDRDNVPIPNLYAAGEMIGGFFFGRYLTTEGGAAYYRGNYHATCGSLSACVVFGRIAGSNAAKARSAN